MVLLFPEESPLDKQKAKTLFDNLAAGDMITADSKEELVVLRVKPDGSKLLGRIHEDHAHPLPYYFTWNDQVGMPTSAASGMGLKWENPQIAKDAASPKLLAMYKDFPVEEDYFTEGIHNKAGELHQEVKDRIRAIAMSEAHDALVVTATLRTMGVGITDEQAYMAYQAIEARRNAHHSSIGDLFTHLGKLLKGELHGGKDGTDTTG